jgi:hypothetical protein
MSSTSINPTMAIIPPPPPGMNYIAAMQPSVNLLIITVAFLGMFMPLLIALFLFSSGELRRKPIFILNVLAVLFGIALASLSIWAQVGRFQQLTWICPDAFHGP